MDAIDRKLNALVKKYKKITSAPIEPGTHKQTASILAEIRAEQDALLDQKLDKVAEEETSQLEAAFSVS